MALSALFLAPSSYAVFGFITACIAIAVLRSRAAGIDHIPGPFMSKYTDALRAYMAYKYSGREENLFMNLHRKYGDVVRIGPRSVSVLDPRAVSTLYGVKARLNKVCPPVTISQLLLRFYSLFPFVGRVQTFYHSMYLVFRRAS